MLTSQDCKQGTANKRFHLAESSARVMLSLSLSLSSPPSHIIQAPQNILCMDFQHIAARTGRPLHHSTGVLVQKWCIKDRQVQQQGVEVRPSSYTRKPPSPHEGDRGEVGEGISSNGATLKSRSMKDGPALHTWQQISPHLPSGSRWWTGRHTGKYPGLVPAPSCLVCVES